MSRNENHSGISSCSVVVFSFIHFFFNFCNPQSVLQKELSNNTCYFSVGPVGLGEEKKVFSGNFHKSIVTNLRSQNAMISMEIGNRPETNKNLSYDLM